MKKALAIIAALSAISSCSLFPFLNRVQADTQLAATSVSASSRSTAAPRALANGSIAVTPRNASGKVITVSVMVGDYGGYALFLITPDEAGFGEPSVTSDSLVLESFDLSDPVTVSREMSLDGPNYPADEQAFASRIELLFAWVDLEFTLDTGPMAGDHTVRVAYADVTDLGYRKGDLLYKDADGTFRWVDTAATSAGSALVSTRPAAPAIISALAQYDGTEDGMGNQHIPTFSANIPSDERLLLSREDLTAGGPWQFTVYFDLTDGMGFSEPLENLDSVQTLVESFQIAADVGTGEVGFAASLDVRETPQE